MEAEISSLFKFLSLSNEQNNRDVNNENTGSIKNVSVFNK